MAAPPLPATLSARVEYFISTCAWLNKPSALPLPSDMLPDRVEFFKNSAEPGSLSNWTNMAPPPVELVALLPLNSLFLISRKAELPADLLKTAPPPQLALLPTNADWSIPTPDGLPEIRNPPPQSLALLL